MSKGALTAIIIGVVVAIGGGAAFWIANQPATDQSSAEQTTTETQPAGETKTSASIMEFLNAGDNRECTYTDDGVSGTMYFASGERLRMDYHETDDDDPSSGGMIVAGDKQYVWDNREKTGFMFTHTDTDHGDDHVSGDDSLQADDDTADLDREYSFTCKSWQVDTGKFTPPEGIEFQDFSAIMEQQAN